MSGLKQVVDTSIVSSLARPAIEHETGTARLLHVAELNAQATFYALGQLWEECFKRHFTEREITDLRILLRRAVTLADEAADLRYRWRVRQEQAELTEKGSDGGAG